MHIGDVFNLFDIVFKWAYNMYNSIVPFRGVGSPATVFWIFMALNAISLVLSFMPEGMQDSFGDNPADDDD